MHTHENLEIVIAAAREAGAAILRHYRPGETVHARSMMQDKGYDNPLTRADLEADHILKERLLTQWPEDGWLSEESADHPRRLQCGRVWVVDPLDGTKEFIQGIPQFAVSVALVEAGKPVLAVVHNPALNETFSAWAGGGAWCNGAPLRVSATDRLTGAACIASRSETRRGDWKPFAHEFRLTEVGSIAYKLAVLAAGRFDLTFTLSPKNEWDICAGVLLVEEAGGRVSDKEGRPLGFNRPDPLLLAVLASNGLLHGALVERLREVPLSPGREKPRL